MSRGRMRGWMSPDVSFRAKRTIFILFTVWALMVVVAPLSLPQGSVPDLSGRPGSIDNMDEIGMMNPFAALVYLAGDVYCHQMAERSLYINGNEMPFCARDVAIFCGLSIGMALVMTLNPRFYQIVLIALFSPIVLDGGAQFLGTYESNNVLRVTTGLLGGLACSYLLGHLADRALGPQRSTIKDGKVL